MRKTLLWFFGIILFVAASVYLARGPLVTLACRQVLLPYLPKAKIRLDDFEWKEGKCTIHDFAIADENCDWIRVEKVECDLGVRWSPLRIRPKILLDGVALQAKKPSGEKGSLEKVRKTLAKQQVIDLTITRGTVRFDETAPDLAFSLEPSSLKGHLGTVRFGKEAVCIDLFAKGKDLYTKIGFAEADLGHLAAIGRFYGMPWEVEEGIASGSFELGIHRKKSIDHLRLSATVTGLVGKGFGAESLTAEARLPEAGTLPVRGMGWKTVVEQCIAQVDVKKGSLLVKNAVTGKEWKIDRFDGKMDGKERRFPTVEGGGIVLFGGEGIPFDVGVDGELKGHPTAHATLDFLGGTKASLDLEWGDKSIQCAWDIVDLSGTPLHMAQDAAALVGEMPAHLSEGVLSGTGEMIVERGQLLALTLHRFSLTGLKGYYGETKVEAIQLRGKANYHRGTPLSCDLFLRGAHAGEYAGIRGAIHCHRGEVSDSTLSGEWRGNAWDAELSGSFCDLGVRAHATLSDAFPLSAMWQEARALYPEIEPPTEASAHFSLRDLHEGWQVEGSSLLVYADESTDKVSFSLVAVGDTLCDAWQKKRVSGAFEAKDLSHYLFAIPLGVTQDVWQLRGSADVAGEFDERGLLLIATPKQLAFSSADFSIEAGVATQPSRLYWDFATGEWKGTIAIEKSRAHQRRYNLDFADVRAKIDVCGALLEARGVETTVEGVALAGCVTFDIEGKHNSELSIAIDRAEGTTADLQALLRHFDDLAELDVPIDGKVAHAGSSWLTVKVRDGVADVTCDLSLDIYSGSCPLAPSLRAEDLAFTLHWDSRKELIEITDMRGFLNSDSAQRYLLSSRYFRCTDLKTLRWEFDVRAATSTYDILRLKGMTHKEAGELHFTLDPNYSHLYRGKLAVETWTTSLDFAPHLLKLKTTMNVPDCAFALDFLAASGIVPIKEGLLNTLQSARLPGTIEIDLALDASSEDLICDIKGVSFPFHLSLDKSAETIEVKKFGWGRLTGSALLEKEERGWRIPLLKTTYGDSSLLLRTGFFNTAEKTLHLDIDAMRSNLSEVRRYLFDIDHLTGYADGTGTIDVDFSRGWTAWEAKSSLHLSCDAFGKGETRIKSRFPVDIALSADGILECEQVKLKCWEESDEIWSEIDIAKLTLDLREKTLDGNGVRMVLPPEMALHFATHGLFPGLKVEENTLQVSGINFVWENQLAGEFDFHYSPGTFKAHGLLQEGYYWLGNRSWFLKDFAFNFDSDRLRLTSQIELADFTFDVSSAVTFGSEISGQLSISESKKGEEIQSLAFFFRYNKERGFTLQGVEGTLYGLTCNLHHNPRVYLPNQLILTGSIGIDSVALMKLFPAALQYQLEGFGIGRGYELSGDLVLSTQNLPESRFKGYLKGRDFALLGYELKTLLSEIEISQKQVLLRDFRLSDDGGVFLAKEIRNTSGDDGWTMTIPEIVVQDLRPSLLKGISLPRGSLKPFVIKDLRFCNIEGTLGKPETFTGRGYLDFYNTFKRDFHLLDIPFDIIGRLGLDLGLFVPVKGKVDYQMRDGKIFLTSLTESYSDGERSQFYFPEHKESFIALDGSLHIDIKMKQYVLLKFTEPFTVSIRGTLTKPRIGLK